MAGRERGQVHKKSKFAKPKQPKFNYFLVNDELHKKLVIDRAADEIIAHNFPQNKRMTYVYSDCRRRSEPVFTTTATAKMLNRTPLTLKHAIYRGDIHTPHKAFSISTGKFYCYFWSEKNILELHEFLMTRAKGRRRKDGLYTPIWMPSRKEIRAMIAQEQIIYVKEGDEFKPTWLAREI